MSNDFDDLLEKYPDIRRRYELISKVGAESERGMTILAAAELDRALEVLLKSYLAPGKARNNLFAGAPPPFGSFAVKINVARALFLIRGDEYQLLHIIRRIRNKFAHNPDVDFRDIRVSSWMKGVPEREGASSDAKSKFTQCSAELIVTLEVDALHDANGRVYEELFNTFYRRGCDHNAPAFNSAEEAAAAYGKKK